MNEFLNSINKQIDSSRGKNIFSDDPDIFQFVRETVKAVSKIKKIDENSEQILVDYAADKAIDEFYRVNQYYTFDEKAKKELKNIYNDLFKNIRAGEKPVETISKIHYQKLRLWLKSSNAFAEKVYQNAGEKIEAVACSEYSPGLQIEIFNIDINKLAQPVLDIGCGSQGNLVSHLNKHGIEAFGIDRYKFNSSNLITTDWLEYNYGIKKWGTIVSNLGFSNHFNHHNLRTDGYYIAYAKTYMNILHSLKISGSFFYAPDLPFIEKYLDKGQFEVKRSEIENYSFNTTVIKRLV